MELRLVAYSKQLKNETFRVWRNVIHLKHERMEYSAKFVATKHCTVRRVLCLVSSVFILVICVSVLHHGNFIQEHGCSYSRFEFDADAYAFVQGITGELINCFIIFRKLPAL